jgi:outer membrane receptor protein involved in Fe transport
MLSSSASTAAQEPPGSLRGAVYDKDYDSPLGGAQVSIVEIGLKVATTDEGHYVFEHVPPGRYTVVFSKEGFVRQVKTDVVVTSGKLTDLDAWLAGEFTEMEELLVQDLLQLGSGTEASLLKMRFQSPSLMDSISSDLMSRAGASDAASALRLVAGTSVQDGKYAVVRGLPDRYVSSQMNGVRLPTADENKRAVQLDQFPSSVIDSVQVSKTFTPDQQGDASGGAVNVRLRGVPDETICQFKTQISTNSQSPAHGELLTYDGGGVNTWGRDDGGRDVQTGNLGTSWDGAVGVKPGRAPVDEKSSLTIGRRHELEDGTTLGGLVSVFYERSHNFIDNKKDDTYWVTHPGDPMTPQTYQGTPGQGDFKTALYDVTQGSESVKWGALTTLGFDTKKNSLALNFLYTHSAEDKATLAEDTRGKAYYFPGYDPNNPVGPGNDPDHLHAAPYIRLETLEYTERTAATLQFTGRHTLPIGDFEIGDLFKCRSPEIGWTVAFSSSGLDQPDKRQFGALWLPPSYHAGGPFSDPYTSPPTWLPYKPAENFNLGNLQRIWKSIDETSEEYALDLKLPFEQWSEGEGYVKFGALDDRLHRKFNQDTFSNFGDSASYFFGDWNDPWSDVFPFEDHPVTASNADVDYKGEQEISAWYGMLDLPLSPYWRMIGGARVESTHLSVVNNPEADAIWYPPGSSEPTHLNPGDADVDFSQQDLLPAVELVFTPVKQLTFRGSFAETVARQTFKELTPIQQQEYLGAPVFVGNPDLKMSELKNYDLRVDYVPYEGGLLSASWFYKDIKDPIEYVQALLGFAATTAVNYPKGEMNGYELEARQSLGHLWRKLEGVAVGANATFIDSEVTLPPDVAAGFDDPAIQAPMHSRDMTNAPDHLYNLFATYDLPESGTQFGLFYTIQGDTLVAGATQSNGNFVPSVYAREYDTLNASVAQRLGKYLTLQLQAKNLTNPRIEEVYRSKYIPEDVVKTSYTKGIEYSVALTAKVSF